ncbi:MAG: tRNA (adenosine(37)-N6)-threonylcarbamoyltransferase complex ATPase subunit type 1 TsaE [Planctomycetota bacterium]
MASVRSFHSGSTEATEAFGAALGRRLTAGHVLALVGELGAGKTTLVRGLARGLGVAADDVSSPTFALMHEYEGRLPVRHFDAWMAGREALFLEGGGAELLGGEGVALIEWADRIEPWLPPTHLCLAIAHVSASERSLRLEARGGDDSALGCELVTSLEVPPGVREVASNS